MGYTLEAFIEMNKWIKIIGRNTLILVGLFFPILLMILYRRKISLFYYNLIIGCLWGWVFADITRIIKEFRK